MDMENTNWSIGSEGLYLRPACFGLALAAFLVLLTGFGSVTAQEAGGIPFFVDTAGFKTLTDPGMSYMEIYILLSSKSLEFKQEEENYRAHLGIEAVVQGIDGTEKWSRRWHKEIFISSTDNLEQGYSILDIVGLILEPDFYSLRVGLRDELSGDTGFVAGELYVPAFPPDTLSMSQLELALEVTTSKKEGDFVKNGLYVLPNPIRTYGPKTPILYYYVEIYDFLLGTGLDSTYTIQQEILTTFGDLVKSYEPKTKIKPGQTCVEVGGINVVGLNPETYLCRIKVRDNASGMEVYNQRWFRVSSPGGDMSQSSPVYVALTLEEAEYQQNLINYIATKRELDAYKDLSLEGKARFLEDFWRIRDPDPSTSENEFQKEYLRRWSYANQRFSRFKLDDGWKTDQGRVYILYGPPDDIERFPSDISTLAWERWHYYSLEGGVGFIFGDLGGFDNFILIHSTARGECRDPHWPERLARAVGQ